MPGAIEPRTHNAVLPKEIYCFAVSLSPPMFLLSADTLENDVQPPVENSLDWEILTSGDDEWQRLEWPSGHDATD